MPKIILKRIINEVTSKPHKTKITLYKGAVAYIKLSQKMTKFDIYAILYAQRSKKQRSNEIRVRAGGTQQYQYIGKIIKIKRPQKDRLAFSILIRNLVDLVSFEINLPLFSPLITQIETKNNQSGLTKYPRSNSFFLRRTQPIKSYTEFKYVIN